MLTTCKLQLAKGHICQLDKEQNSDYCYKHKRYQGRDDLLAQGQRPCARFVYGCDILVKTKFTRCIECIKNPNVKDVPCGHKTCTDKTYGEKYCGRHYRDMYRDEEVDKGFKYCNIDRGCFNKAPERFAHCEACRKDSAQKEAERTKATNEKNKELEKQGASERICIGCPRMFTPFMTQHKELSKRCEECHKYNIQVDVKREGRVRNYREERFRNINQQYKDYVKSAKLRNHSFDLTLEELKELSFKKCYYCDSIKDKEINGIDRINNDLGYDKENCVSCCTICNRMKIYYHPLFFIQLCRIYSSPNFPPKTFYKHWFEYYGKTSNKCFSYYKKTTEARRNIKVNITQDDWDELTILPCYLCGYSDPAGIGLDRVDNTKREYTRDNIKPCCSNCNMIKGELSLDALLEKAKLISEKWSDTTIFEVIPRTKNIMKKSLVNNDESVKKRRGRPAKLGNQIEEEQEQEQEQDEQASWTADEVYTDILSGSNEFADSQVNLEEDEYIELQGYVLTQNKESTIAYIKALLFKLQKKDNSIA